MTTLSQDKQIPRKMQVNMVLKTIVFLGRMQDSVPGDRLKKIEPEAAVEALDRFLKMLRGRGPIREKVLVLCAEWTVLNSTRDQIVELADESDQDDLLLALSQIEGQLRLFKFIYDINNNPTGRRFEPLGR